MPLVSLWVVVLCGVAFVLHLLSKTSLLQIILLWLRSLNDLCFLYVTYRVPQLSSGNQPNPLFAKVQTYLDSLPSLENDAVPTALISGTNQNDIVLAPDATTRPVPDSFLGASLSWAYEACCSGGPSWVLRLRKKDKKRVLKAYLEKVLAFAQEKKGLVFNFNLNVDGLPSWIPGPFSHPATMETIAMDQELKTMVKLDLENFVKARQYYHRLGRIWKRSYLIYGGPGTGKSTFVAAIANFLRFDVYELDVSSVANDGELKELLLKTTRRSIILVEDLDRYLSGKMKGRVSHAGLMSLMDGTIAGCCGEERVMIFTITDRETSSPKKSLEEYLKLLDPAITRPGRIDVRIELPGTDTFSIFKGLASNYLGVKEHKLFSQIEEIFRGGAKLNPAEISEIMMSNRGSPSRALKSVMTALGRKPLRGPSVGGEEEIAEDSSALLQKENGQTVRELGNLYGLFRVGSRRKTDDPSLWQ